MYFKGVSNRMAMLHHAVNSVARRVRGRGLEQDLNTATDANSPQQRAVDSSIRVNGS